MIIEEDDYLAHYGVLRRSGRYPWGSGNSDFLNHIASLEAAGLTQLEIAKGLDISLAQLRNAKSIAKSEQKQADAIQAMKLKESGMSNSAIGREMGKPESVIRTLLAPQAAAKAQILAETAATLRNEVADKKYIDIGSGAETRLNISTTKLKTAVHLLEEEGYKIWYLQVPQLTGKGKTSLKVLAGPESTWPEVYGNRDNIQITGARSSDGGMSYDGFQPPIQVNPNRLAIKYKEDGGADADGVIYVRPGVPDLSLGNSRYAQVRVSVGDGHYLKGMAIYKPDLPEGVDLLFNTNKTNTGNKLDALKPIKEDPENPYGAITSQIFERLPDGSKRVTSAMNKVNEEGDWSRWSKTLSSQMLSKQPITLAKAQLADAYDQRKATFDEINALTNPAVKKKLLEAFSDSTDAAAVNLKAAALKGQASHVILPVASIPENQVYAPEYTHGDRVVLVRFPHGGTFEIPELTVNNRHRESRELLGNRPRDAIGIHPKVAERLSGADFDGDTVLVIPNNEGRVKSTPALKGLENFDPKVQYAGYPGMKVITPGHKQKEMGVVSNLITDMTIRKASTDEMAAAVRHSMVVIDAENHKLDYRRSAIENGIPNLKAKYQTGLGTGSGSGASTLISRAQADIRIPEKELRKAKDGGPIDKTTGKFVWVQTNESWVDTKGNTNLRLTKSKQLAETEDANTLSSGTPIERVYAEHSNKMKALANQARLVAVNTPASVYSPSANQTYSKEVESLNVGLDLAIRNRPLERQAQVIGGAAVKAKQKAYPDMDDKALRRLRAMELEKARSRVGAKKPTIDISPEEWNAIQAGAIHNNKLLEILKNADLDQVKEYATPREKQLMTSSMVNRAQSMAANGYTRKEIAQRLGVSLSTLTRADIGT